MKKICIIYGGPSKESEVSLLTTKEILKNIDFEKYLVSLLYIDKELMCSLDLYSKEYLFKPTGKKSFKDFLPKLKSFDLCLLSLHGKFGEDGTVQKLFDDNNINYSGSGSDSSKLCFDKLKSSLLVEKSLDIDIPQTLLWRKDLSLEEIEKNFKYPLILKPNKEGSSFGVFLINSRKDLEEAVLGINEEYIVQEAILDSVEVTCGVLEKENGEVIKLPPVEIKPILGGYFDFNSKYKTGGAEEIVPPVSIGSEESEYIMEMSIKVHRLLGCKLYSRTDYLIKNGRIYYLETNTLPGLTSTSLLPKECNAIGMSYNELVDFLIKNSL